MPTMARIRFFIIGCLLWGCWLVAMTPKGLLAALDASLEDPWRLSRPKPRHGHRGCASGSGDLGAARRTAPAPGGGSPAPTSSPLREPREPGRTVAVLRQ